MSVTLRILTEKSKLSFGKYKDYTVRRLIDLGRENELISAYYKLSKITFVESVLKELKIKGDYAINKPGVNKELYYDFLNKTKGPKKLRTREGANRLKKENKNLTKGQLQRINHGFKR